MITTLHIRFPYSPYTREAYLLSADVAFKKKRYELAISEFREFINNQVNHPKIEYATFKILKSYSLLMSTKDKNEDPAKAILQIYDSLTAVYKSSEYMKETEKIYLKAKRYILKRAIYVAFFVNEKKYNGKNLKYVKHIFIRNFIRFNRSQSHGNTIKND